MPKDALLIVDVQNDFCPGGSLAVPEGDIVIEPINKLIPLFDLIIASRDWHPPVTNHFRDYGGSWPVHCVRDSWGAKFRSNLLLPESVIVISKGTHKDEDGYSAFRGKTDFAKGFFIPIYLNALLENCGVSKLFVCGLATDYCVKSTVLDALRLGYKVIVLEDAIRGVDVNHGDSERAKKEMRRSGAKFTTTEKILSFCNFVC